MKSKVQSGNLCIKFIHAAQRQLERRCREILSQRLSNDGNGLHLIDIGKAYVPYIFRYEGKLTFPHLVEMEGNSKRGQFLDIARIEPTPLLDL